MLKKYEISDDPRQCKNEKTLYRMRITLQGKINAVLNGQKFLLKNHEKYEIWKVKLPYEIKLVCIIKKTEDKYLVIESVAVSANKSELLKMQVEFNTALKKEGVCIAIKDTNSY